MLSKRTRTHLNPLHLTRPLRSLLPPEPGIAITFNASLRCLAALGEGGFEPPWENTGRFTACCFRPLSHSPSVCASLALFSHVKLFFCSCNAALVLIGLNRAPALRLYPSFWHSYFSLPSLSKFSKSILGSDVLSNYIFYTPSCRSIGVCALTVGRKT